MNNYFNLSQTNLYNLNEIEITFSFTLYPETQ